jgi:DNA-binding PadR family transcriptional regulator
MLRTLDLFLLTLVRDGIRTPYDWQAQAGVSLGASLPAIKRLVDGGMVVESAKGSRGRREFSITRSGRSELQKTDVYLAEASEDGPSDLESVLRLACIAISEGKPGPAKKLLLQSADEHAKRARRAKRRASVQLDDSSLAKLYSAAMAFCDESRQNATSESLASLISVLGLDPGRASRLPNRRKSTR